MFFQISLLKKRNNNNYQKKAAEGGVESTTMKHIMTNSQQSFNSQDIKLPTSTQQKTDLGTEAKNKNNWVTVNHDI